MANTKLTLRRRKRFFEELASTGHVVNSAAAAGVDRVYMYQLRREDKEFAAEWEKALELAVGMFEDEGARRAVHGVDKPVFYQGVQCGVIREYSDTLLTTLLKAHKPDMYRERVSTELTGANGGPILTKSADDLSDEQLAFIAGTSSAAPAEPEKGES